MKHQRVRIVSIAVIVASVLLAVTVAHLGAAFTALCGTGTSCAYVVGDKFGYQTVEKIRQNFNALVAPQYWTGAADTSLTGEKNLGVLSTGLVINTAGVPSAYAGGSCAGGTVVTATSASGALTCAITPATASSTTTETNKTIDAEGTGNVITIPEARYWPAAVCDQGGVYMPEWNGNGDTTSPAYGACFAGTNNQGAGLDFADTSTEQIWKSIHLPSDWTGAVDLSIYWTSSATTGSVVWQVQLACTAVGETIDPSWNTANTVTTATQGVANRFNASTLTGLTTTGCAAGEMLWFRILRDPAHASDTLGATATMLGAELKYRRAL